MVNRIGDVYFSAITLDKLEIAAKQSCRSRKDKAEVAEFLRDKDRKLRDLQESLRTHQYRTSEWRMFEKVENVERPPHRPTVSSRRAGSGSGEIACRPVTTPIVSPASTLATNVPAGRPGSRPPRRSPRPQRAMLPAAPPAATAMSSVMNQPFCRPFCGKPYHDLALASRLHGS